MPLPGVSVQIKILTANYSYWFIEFSIRKSFCLAAKSQKPRRHDQLGCFPPNFETTIYMDSTDSDHILQGISNLFWGHDERWGGRWKGTLQVGCLSENRFLPIFSCPSSSLPTLVSEWVSDWFMIINLSDRPMRGHYLTFLTKPLKSWEQISSHFRISTLFLWQCAYCRVAFIE